MIEKTEKQIMSEIESGKYRDFYLIYNRKSTDEPNNQRNSIKVQRTENVRFALNKKLLIAPITIEGFCSDGIISERHSGYKEDDAITFSAHGLVQYRVERPKFLKLVELLSRGLFKGTICLCWDRISRNKADSVIVRKLMKSGADIRFVYATYDKSSSGEFHMDIDSIVAEHTSRITSEKVKMATWMLRNKGVCTFKAAVGYLNLGTMEHKPFDPKRGPIITGMFEMYSTDKFSLTDVAIWATKEGFTTAPMRPKRTKQQMLAEENDDDEEMDEKEKEEKKVKKVSHLINANGVQRILTNRFYTGRVPNSDGEWIPSVSHERLVSDEIFEKVQLILKRKNKRVSGTNKMKFPYRGMVRCAGCGRLYTPYKNKIKKVQYYGCRCPRGCNNSMTNFNIDYFEEKVGEVIKNLAFVDDEVEVINATMQTDLAVYEHQRLEKIEQGERRKKKVREDLTYLRTNKLELLRSGAYLPDTIVEEENKLNDELVKIQENELVSDAAMHEVVKDIIKLSELVKYGYKYYEKANSEEKEELIRIIFSELSFSEDTLIYKCQNGIEVLRNRFVSICGRERT